jgi:hypothetical protein
MANQWVYKVQDDYSDSDKATVARKEPEKFVRIVREDAKVVLGEKLKAQVRKEVEELTPEERARLAKALSRPRHLTKTERAEDKAALLLATEKDDGGRSLLLMGDDEKLVGNGNVTRLDLTKSERELARDAPPPLGEAPSVTLLRIERKRR